VANVAEVQAELVAAEDEADRGITDLMSALDLLDRAITRLQQAASGSGQPSIREAIARLDAAKALLRDALKLTNTAITSSQDYRRTM
jgi:hypothetical protein